jgi:hypothetical protein
VSEAEGVGVAVRAELHALDAACDLIIAERVPDDPAWAALRDRLERAAR